MASCGKIQENQSQERKHQGLNEAYEDFQTVEWEWRDERYQETDHQEQHFSGEDIAEKTEGEGNHFWKFWE